MVKKLFLLLFVLIVFSSSVFASCGSGCCNCTTYAINGTFIDTYNNATNRTEHIWVDGNFTKTDCVGVGDKHIFETLLGIIAIITFLLLLAFKLDETHKLLKTFILLISIYLALLIPRTLVVLINNDISVDLLKYYLIFVKIISWYILFYFIWSIAEYYGKTAEIRRFFKDKFGNKGGNNET